MNNPDSWKVKLRNVSHCKNQVIYYNDILEIWGMWPESRLYFENSALKVKLKALGLV